MTDFIKTLPQAHVTLNKAIVKESFKTVAHRLSAVFQRFARWWTSGARMMQNLSAYKEQYQEKADRYGFFQL